MDITLWVNGFYLITYLVISLYMIIYMYIID